MIGVNAARLIARNAESVIYYQQTGGGWDKDTGRYTKPTGSGVNQTATIVSFSDEDLRTTDGGQLTSDDRKAYTTVKWKVGSHVKRVGTGITYRVEAMLKDYGIHVGGYVFHITTKGVSVP